mgnify:CR=1 FL=1
MKISRFIVALTAALLLSSCGSTSGKGANTEDSEALMQQDKSSFNGPSGAWAGASRQTEEEQKEDGGYAAESMEKPIYVCLTGEGRIAVIDENNDLYVWGDNTHGVLGTGDTNDVEAPTKIMENIKKVCFAQNDDLAILSLDGSLYTCGWNEKGWLGDGSCDDKHTPNKILDDVDDMIFGRAITYSGELYAWGNNASGQIGDGTFETRLEPVKVMENVKKVRTGGGNVLALTTDDSLYSMGQLTEYYGGTYVDSNIDHRKPSRIMEGIIDMDAGYAHAGAVNKNGELYMWGSNMNGQLTDRVRDETREPIMVMENVRTVRFDDSRSWAITNDNELMYWGYNSVTVDGTTTYKDIYTPVKQMDGIEDFIDSDDVLVLKSVDGDFYTTVDVVEQIGLSYDGSPEDEYVKIIF